MACNESDEKLSIQSEILKLEMELESLRKEVYDISMKRKFIKHRIADLRYRLKELDGLV